MKWILFVIVFSFSLTLFADTPPGKQMTDREIAHKVVVNASQDKVFELWMSEEGVKKFLGVSAEIEKKVGGKYFIYFDSKDRQLSTEGAKILRYEPNSSISFEWRGKPEMVEMNVEPFPTWVEIEFEPVGASKTKVDFHHYGFGKGGTWDQAYDFFNNAWKFVLENLVKSFP
jgi:uncharacterized protein YndB with AHSA1/START domain